MTAQQVNEWRIIPRLMVLASVIMAAYIATWITGLDEPSTQQVGFASTILLAILGDWVTYKKSGGTK